eukprot:jgi/Galph1/374/GphlegSOOS_G5037.1
MLERNGHVTCFSVPHRSGVGKRSREPTFSKTRLYEHMGKILSSLEEPHTAHPNDDTFHFKCHNISSIQRRLEVSDVFWERLLAELSQECFGSYHLSLLVQLTVEKCFCSDDKDIQWLKEVLDRDILKDYNQYFDFFLNINIYIHFLYLLGCKEEELEQVTNIWPWTCITTTIREGVFKGKPKANGNHCTLTEISVVNLDCILTEIFILLCDFCRKKFQEKTATIALKEAAFRCLLFYLKDPYGKVRVNLVMKLDMNVWIQCLKDSSSFSSELETYACSILCLVLTKINNLNSSETIFQWDCEIDREKSRRLLFSIILHLTARRLDFSFSETFLWQNPNASQSFRDFIALLKSVLAAEALAYIFRRCPRNFVFDILRHVFIDAILSTEGTYQRNQQMNKSFAVRFFLALERTAIEFQGVNMAPKDDNIAEVENEFWVTTPIPSYVHQPYSLPVELVQRLIFSSSPLDVRFGGGHIAEVIAYSLDNRSEPTQIIELYQSWVFQHLCILFREIGKETQLVRSINFCLDCFVSLESLCQQKEPMISPILKFFETMLDYLIDWQQPNMGNIDLFETFDSLIELVCNGYVILNSVSVSALSLKSLQQFSQMLKNITEDSKSKGHDRSTGMPVDSYLSDTDVAIRKVASSVVTEVPNVNTLEGSTTEISRLVSQIVEN